MTVTPLRSARSVARTSRHLTLAPAELLEIAEGFARSAGSWPGLDSPVERCWRTIAVTDRFEAWVVAWPVGGAIELHDHGDAGGVVVVVTGRLVETALQPGSGGRVTTRSTPVTGGGHVEFGPGHVHDLVNDGPVPAKSVHVYTPALRTMTYFDRRHEGVVAGRTEHYRDGLLVG